MARELSKFVTMVDDRLTKGRGIATVKQSVPPNRLKVMNLEDGFGWEEICPLLGVPVPESLEWPGRNPPEVSHRNSGPIYRRALRKAIIGVTTILGTAIAVGVWVGTTGGKLPKSSFILPKLSFLAEMRS
ncbi:hypothetical protein SLS62_006018 [Diatrype stigma]|uniref:Uncharacterized protein n=1 Tax=Diatrype stigma TaxID=117547 RepID=A0AAN9UQJ8_9PEZI